MSLNGNIKIAPVLKSNAYGHGLVEVGKILDKQKAPFFCVNSLEEAMELYHAKITTPVLIMGHVNPQSLKKIKKPSFSYAIHSIEIAKLIAKLQPRATFHLFVDTGMHREGIPIEDLKNVIVSLPNKLKKRIVGLMSHLAQAAKPNDPSTKKQIKNFEKAKIILKVYGITPIWIHLSASSGMLNFRVGNVARVGLALYGIDPADNNKKLKPSLKLITKLVQMKQLKKGDKVGYDFTYTSLRSRISGLLPIGYNDGFDRRLSNKGFVLINNVKCSIIGKISMNLSMIDISKIKSPKIGLEVVIFSENPKDPNSIQNAAKFCQTTAYDLLVRLNPSIIRRVV